MTTYVSARSRLTLLYASLFTLGGTALVLITYLLVAHNRRAHRWAGHQRPPPAQRQRRHPSAACYLNTCVVDEDVHAAERNGHGTGASRVR